MYIYFKKKRSNGNRLIARPTKTKTSKSCDFFFLLSLSPKGGYLPGTPLRKAATVASLALGPVWGRCCVIQTLPSLSLLLSFCSLHFQEFVIDLISPRAPAATTGTQVHGLAKKIGGRVSYAGCFFLLFAVAFPERGKNK